MTAEGNGSSDEGPINKNWKSVRVKASRQRAAIFTIEDQSRLSAQLEGRRVGAGNRRRRKEPATRTWSGGRCARAGGAASRGGLGRSPRWERRRRADPLGRVGCSAPRPPRLRRHQERLCKQTWASPPVLARARSCYLSLSVSFWVSSLIYSLDCRGEGRGGGGGGGGGGGAEESGGGGCRNGRMAGRETCGRERLRLAPPGKSGGGGRGGQREGRASEQSGGDRPGTALHTRQKGTPKVGVGLRRGREPCPVGLPADSQKPREHPQPVKTPADYLASFFGGYFCTGRECFPPPCTPTPTPDLLSGAEATSQPRNPEVI